LADALTIENLSVRYGQIIALDSVSLSVRAGTVVSVIGANGVGKSTLLKAVVGVVKVASGHIRDAHAEITGRPAYRAAREGISLVAEGHRVIATLTIEDNLKLGYAAVNGRRGGDLASHMDEVLALFPALKPRLRQVSGSLSGGERQMLAMARGLICDPSVLLLDEPSLGLAPVVIDQIYDFMVNAAQTRPNMAILLAEQSAALALSAATYVYVLSRGKIVLEGTTESVSNNDRMLELYMGRLTGWDG
jgi:branched-chain amino acid transport system ATP-binding protein